MILIKHTTPTMIIAQEGKHIRNIDDIYVEEHIDEETGERVEEHFPYYTTVIFVPNTFTEEQMNELYVEENIEE